MDLAFMFFMIEIIKVETDYHIRSAQELLLEYETVLGLDLSFQDFEREVNDLKKAYSEPDGYMFLAFFDGQLAGCAALRKLSDGICEMKRLYVRSSFRGRKVGFRLIETIIGIAREAGFGRMRLDTDSSKMSRALDLYLRIGFQEIAPYYANPNITAVYLELEL